MQEDTDKTIEAVLFDALLKTRLIESRATSNYHRCGRTDKGVSAFSQVKRRCHFHVFSDCCCAFNCIDWKFMLIFCSLVISANVNEPFDECIFIFSIFRIT